MNRTRMLCYCLVLVVILVMFVLFVRWDTKRTVNEMFQRREQAMVDAWRGKVFPLYEELSIKHDKDPETLIDLFTPLLRLLETTGLERAGGAK